MQVKIKKLDEAAKIPTRGSDYAAGYDLYALERTVIEGDSSVKIRTGIAVEIPEGYFGAIYARSGLATKHGLRPANCVGVIDSDYRGEVIVCLHNDSSAVKIVHTFVTTSTYQVNATENHDASYTIEPGERIAQLIIQKFEPVEFIEVDELGDSKRGSDGFGSTGNF